MGRVGLGSGRVTQYSPSAAGAERRDSWLQQSRSRKEQEEPAAASAAARPLPRYTLTGGARAARALRGQEGNHGLLRLGRLGAGTRAPGWPAASGRRGGRSPRA